MGSRFGHGLVNRIVNCVAARSVTRCRVTVSDRFASEADVNFGINFASNRLFNVVVGIGIVIR